MSNKHSVVLPDDNTVTRTSANKVYTHVVAYYVPADLVRQRLIEEATYRQEQVDRYRALAAKGGTSEPRANGKSFDISAAQYTVWADDNQAKSDALIEKAAVATDSKWALAGWCSRIDLAVKLGATEAKRGHRVEIIETTVR